MSRWVGSNGLWLSFPPPLSFHFLITSTLPSLSAAQTRLSLCYFTFCSVPHLLVVLRHDPAAAGNGHLQQSFLSCLFLALFAILTLDYPHSLPSSTHSPTHTHTRAHRQSHTHTLKAGHFNPLIVTRQLPPPCSPAVPLPHPPSTILCWTISGASSNVALVFFFFYTVVAFAAVVVVLQSSNRLLSSGTRSTSECQT